MLDLVPPRAAAHLAAAAGCRRRRLAVAATRRRLAVAATRRRRERDRLVASACWGGMQGERVTQGERRVTYTVNV